MLENLKTKVQSPEFKDAAKKVATKVAINIAVLVATSLIVNGAKALYNEVTERIDAEENTEVIE